MVQDVQLPLSGKWTTVNACVLCGSAIVNLVYAVVDCHAVPLTKPL